MKAFIRLIRIPNILIVIITMYFVRFFLIQPISESFNGGLFFTELDFFMLVLATVLIMAGGNIINDYFDLAIDETNKPERIIIGKNISVIQARILYFIFNVLGVILGFIVAWSVNQIQLGLIFPLTAYLLYAYSARHKRKAFVGNFIIASLSAFTVFLSWLFEYFVIIKLSPEVIELNLAIEIISRVVLAYVSFAFLMSLIREMIKDVEDIEGDKVNECKTLPILFNLKTIKVLIAFVILLSMGLMIYVQSILWNNKLQLLFWYFVLIHPMFIYLLICLIQSKEKKDFRWLSHFSKAIMLFGIVSMFLIQYA